VKTLIILAKLTPHSNHYWPSDQKWTAKIETVWNRSN